MTRLKQLAATSVVALLCTGCGHSPPVSYYNLGAMNSEVSETEADATIIAIGPLRVPDYLTRPQLVTRGRGMRMIIDDYHRWAEPIEQSLHRVVAANVDGLLPKATVIAFPHNNLIVVDYRLLGTVDRFDVDERGQAVLIVQWGVGDTLGNIIVQPRRSRYEVRAGSDSENAVVQAMTDLVTLYSRDIATQLESALAREAT